MASKIAIAVESQKGTLLSRAKEFALELGLPIVDMNGLGYDVLLVVTDERLELRESGRRTGPVYVNFIGGRMRRRRDKGIARDPLVRAVGRPRGSGWHVMDATAGLGRDAFLLAWAGCNVTAIERSAVVVALLEDGVRRARQDVELQPVMTERFRLVKGDAREILTRLDESHRPNVVYIDPMFPHRSKSAASKKEMQLTRKVAGEDADAEELFTIAMATARHRVVVKRWVNAPVLGRRPNIQYMGQTIRYDVYLRDIASDVSEKPIQSRGEGS